MFSAQDGENLSVTMSCWTSWPVAAWVAATLWSQLYSHIQISDGAGTLFSGVEDIENPGPGSGSIESIRCVERQVIDQKPIHVVDPIHHFVSVLLYQALHVMVFVHRKHPSSAHRRPGRYVEENCSVCVDPSLPSKHEVCDQDPRQPTNLSLGVYNNV